MRKKIIPIIIGIIVVSSAAIVGTILIKEPNVNVKNPSETDDDFNAQLNSGPFAILKYEYKLGERVFLVVDGLQEVFEAFEKITHKHGMEKIKTIGDEFMASAGLLLPNGFNFFHAVLGCDYVQGYYCARPLPNEEFMKLIKSWDGPHQH